MAIGKDEFRQVLSRFATGVTVITVATADGQVHGMTANAFASVSLQPPLILVCVDHQARTHPLLQAQDRFAVNVLDDSQEAIARYYADVHENHDAPQHLGVRYRQSDYGTPVLEPCLAHLECRRVAAHEAGDHTIFVAEVERGHTREGRPLLFYGGRYGPLRS